MIAFTLDKLQAHLPELRIFPGSSSAAAENTAVCQVVTDSRADCRGALFIALTGERFDGHRFLQTAASKGAAMLGVSSDWALAHGSDIARFNAQGITVSAAPSTLDLLGYCALCVREQCDIPVASLSGSCGKTTVKEMTAAMLGQQGKVLYTQGNFNNDVGVPLTLLNLTADTDYAVIEQGASHLGDLARTCRFVKAQTAVLTNIGQAHIEGFGSEEGVYLGKSELIQDVLSRGGRAAVPGDGPWTFRFAVDFASYIKQGRLVFFSGSGADSEALLPGLPLITSAKVISSGPAGIRFNLTCHEQHMTQEVTLSMLGEHNAANAAAAAALALLTGAQVQSVYAGLKQCRSLAGRLNLKQLGAVTLIDDAYNASFNAVTAGLNTLGSFKDCCRIAVLGDMGELGSAAESLHAEVGTAAQGQADALFTLGPLTRATAESYGSSGFNCHAGSHEKLAAMLEQFIAQKLRAGQRVCVLVKGSHAMQMQRVNDFLMQRYS